MKENIFVGIDGGATKSIIRVEKEDGALLGRVIAGPGSLRHSVEATWQVIQKSLVTILTPHTIHLDDPYFSFHVGMGLAGCEIKTAYEAFITYPHAFDTLMVRPDSHTACLAAHEGHDGAVIIIGTGVVGYQIELDQVTKIGGWGFPHDDEGGGAWLGMNAVNATLKYLDGRMEKNELTDAILSYFNKDKDALVAFANQANATHFASLARLVIDALRCKEPFADELLRRAAHEIENIFWALDRKRLQSQPLACALMGSIAPFIEPYLKEQCRHRLRPSALTPDQGAMLLVRHKEK